MTNVPLAKPVVITRKTSAEKQISGLRSKNVSRISSNEFVNLNFSVSVSAKCSTLIPDYGAARDAARENKRSTYQAFVKQTAFFSGKSLRPWRGLRQLPQ